MTVVFIKGLGLIGSSLARAIKEVHPDVKIIASDVNQQSLDYALQHHIIDRAVDGFNEVDSADVIILASPVSQIIQDIQQLATYRLKDSVIVTDVGSTKQTIMAASRVLTDQGITFIGGHPMAGSHKSGVQAGKADLFENAFYFILPGDHQAASQRLEQLLSGTHAKWLTVSAEQHDRIVAQISHVPHVIAAELVNQTRETLKDEPIGMRVAAGGFKSVTRIAASDPTMWSAILLNNRSLILTQLKEYITGLNNVVTLIQNQDRDALFQFFSHAKASRESLNTPAKKPFYDLFLNIPDQVGSLAKVTTLLAQHHLSIVNLQILEVREDVDGILQLTFADANAQQAAAAILGEANYTIVER